MKSKHDFGSFKFLSGDVDFTKYSGLWVRKVGAARYHVVELLNWEGTVGAREAREIGATYNVNLSEVDLGAIGLSGVTNALRSCSFELSPNGDIWGPYSGHVIAERDSPHHQLVLVECCHDYGYKAPISDENGNNWRKLMRAAVRESRALDCPAEHSKAMRRTVNRIGSTAYEYMRGDIDSALVRGVASGDEAALLMAKLHGYKEE